MSLAARLLNVFAIPGEVFEGVKTSRFAVGNWLVPMFLSGAVLALTGILLALQPAFQKQMHERMDQQAKALQQEVKAGKAKQAEVDRTMASIQAYVAPTVLPVLLGAMAGAIGAVRVVWWALALWLLGRIFLKARLDFMKTLEVAGLGVMIAVLGDAVVLLLMVNLPGLFASPGLAQSVAGLDVLHKSPVLLAVANVFSLWLIGVLAVGLAKLARVPLLRAAWFVLAFWLLQASVMVLLGGALSQLAL